MQFNVTAMPFIEIQYKINKEKREQQQIKLNKSLISKALV